MQERDRSGRGCNSVNEVTCKDRALTRGAVDVVGGVDALAGRKVVIGELARIQIAEILRGRPRAADDDGKNQRDSKHAIGCMAVSEHDGSYDGGW